MNYYEYLIHYHISFFQKCKVGSLYFILMFQFGIWKETKDLVEYDKNKGELMGVIKTHLVGYFGLLVINCGWEVLVGVRPIRWDIWE